MPREGAPKLAARYRCTSCGNLTRFDVVERVRSKSFYHFTLGGELSVENTRKLEHEIESVTCRWCQSESSVETIENAPGGEGDESGGTADRQAQLA